MAQLPEIHVHLHAHGFDRIEHKIDHLHEDLKQFKIIIMGALDDVKAQLAVSDEKIDILSTATQGVAADVAFLKAKLEAAPGGIDAAGVAELLAIASAQSQKLSDAATQLADLDASTDSSQP